MKFIKPRLDSKNTTICCIFNLAAHYRAAIYRRIDQEFDSHFYIGDRVHIPIKLMDYEELKGFKGILQYVPLGYNFYWQKNAVKLVFKPYQHYILNGEPHCVSTWLILFFANILGKKTYLWTHGWYGNEGLLKRILKKIFFLLSYKVLLYGDYARQLMIKEGFKPEKLHCIYNSLDYENQCAVRKNLALTDIYKKHFGNDFPVLIYIGRIQKIKKLKLLVEALRILIKKGVECNIVIVGNLADDNSIEGIVTNYELKENVWFYGPCYDERKIGELIFNAELCITPGNIGLTAMHSLAYGTPVITHDNFTEQGPEFEAIEKGVNGDFFIFDNVDSLVNSILNWLNNNSQKSSTMKEDCFSVIDRKYNPNYQIQVLKSCLNYTGQIVEPSKTV
jgi:glycosyltransferase involved in cell wall biosynthesis